MKEFGDCSLFLNLSALVLLPAAAHYLSPVNSKFVLISLLQRPLHSSVCCE